MAAATNLTDAKLKSLKAPATGQQEISDSIVPGLRIRVGKSGTKTFIVRKRVGGKLKNITVGRFTSRLGVGKARQKARQVLSDIEAGNDPSTRTAARGRAGKGLTTVRALWPAYKAEKAHLRTIREVERTFDKYILPEIGDRLADAVTRADITNMIDEIAASAPVMARNVLAQLSAFYTWALPRLERIPGNPCRDAGRPAKPKARDRVLTDEELRALWQVADADAWPWGPGLKLAILTGQRRGEVFGAEWREIDLKARTWTIAAHRAKNGVAHIVPLPEAALAIIRDLPRVEGSGKVFPAVGNPDAATSGVEKAIVRWRAAMLKAMREETSDKTRTIEHWRLHDVRRTVATGLQRLGIRVEVTEAILNHVSGSRAGIVGVYQRHHFTDEKRHALDAWAAEVERIVTVKDRGNVVAIR